MHDALRWVSDEARKVPVDAIPHDCRLAQALAALDRCYALRDDNIPHGE